MIWWTKTNLLSVSLSANVLFLMFYEDHLNQYEYTLRNISPYTPTAYMSYWFGMMNSFGV